MRTVFEKTEPVEKRMKSPLAAEQIAEIAESATATAE
jgi:hypothetical protein